MLLLAERSVVPHRCKRGRDKKLYQHDCPHCIYLGVWVDPKTAWTSDLYVCPVSKHDGSSPYQYRTEQPPMALQVFSFHDGVTESSIALVRIAGGKCHPSWTALYERWIALQQSSNPSHD